MAEQGTHNVGYWGQLYSPSLAGETTLAMNRSQNKYCIPDPNAAKIPVATRRLTLSLCRYRRGCHALPIIINTAMCMQ